METFFSGLESVAIALSFVVAAAAYIADRRKASAAFAALRQQRWQSGVIQRLLQKHASKPARFDEILDRYRSESLAVPNDIGKADLTEEALRSILIELQNKMVVSAVGDDQYKLRTSQELSGGFQDFLKSEGLPFSLLNTMVPALQASLNLTTTEQRLFGLISGILLEEPGKYGIADLTLKIAKQESLDTDLVRRSVTGMVARRYVLEKPDHKLMLATPPISIPSRQED